jgi:hypothetical protein
MTAQALRDRLRAKGVRLSLRRDGQLEAAPRSRLGEADRADVRVHLAALKALLRAEAGEEEETLDPPDASCALCRQPLIWVEDWPEPSEHRWLCLACAARPIPTLADVYAALTTDERHRLDAEAAGGDDLAREIVNALAAAPRGRA